eukprot:TRINITY_DN2891_c0_g1_i2.p1 TRINITY_DN2891_c0_g1~~TRINITY_DN2891_c0_g1_i2.p1  ORF type:complete len:201 (-),score=35.63 TRINITY_DN2891_c0_g1_i2:73-675(-)
MCYLDPEDLDEIGIANEEHRFIFITASALLYKKLQIWQSENMNQALSQPVQSYFPPESSASVSKKDYKYPNNANHYSTADSNNTANRKTPPQSLTEHIQRGVGSFISGALEDDTIRKSVGYNVARSSSNPIVRGLASSQTVQDTVGRGVAKAATNRTVQEKIGNMVYSAATNPEIRGTVLSSASTVGRIGLNAATAYVTK